MAERVDKGLAADPIDLVANDRLQRARPAFDDHAIGGVTDANFLLDAGERLLEIVRRAARASAGRERRCVLRRSLAPSDPARGRSEASPASRSGSRSTATCSCIDALTKPCSSVSCSSCAMRVRSASRSSKRDVELPRDLPDAQAVEAPACQSRQHARPTAGTTSVCQNSRLDFEGQRRLGSVPGTVAVGRDHAKPVRARREVGVDRLPLRDRVAPVAIEPVEPVADT